ncbi:MAG: MFS transporter [Aestuariivita sp.]|nr:MFS transporter [Aestuariivita sp.]MCY4203355.1 MFS transporter [Aestuariivita sp.]
MSQKSAVDSDSASVSWSEFVGVVHLPSVALVCLAVWLHAADSLVVATMLPAIVSEVGGVTLVGWMVALYEIGSIVAGVVSALSVMRFGFRIPMACSALIFAAGCLLSSLGPEMSVILAGRLLQGAGGGGLVAMGFVVISVVFERRYTARILAVVSAFWGLSAFMGPLIGGIFVEFATWRLCFAFFFLQAFALAIWILLRAPTHPRQQIIQQTSVPVLRLLVLSTSVICIAYAGVEISEIKTPLFIGLGLITFVVFLSIDGGKDDANRLLPLSPLNPLTPAGATLSMILALAVATIPIAAFGPLFISAIHGASALTVGYIVACSSIGWTITAIIVSAAPERLDPILICVGVLMVISSIPGFLYAVPNGPLWLIALVAAIEGGDFGVSWTFILRRTTALAAPTDTQRIAAALPTIQRFGYAIGAVYIGLVANAVGFASISNSAEAQMVAKSVFIACIPPALLALPGLWGLVRKQEYEPVV